MPNTGNKKNGKKNLFELKKKYAQLVEAQSPEPDETFVSAEDVAIDDSQHETQLVSPVGDAAPSQDSSCNQHQIPTGAARLVAAAKSTEDYDCNLNSNSIKSTQIADPSDEIMREADRKLSQSSSQVSTSVYVSPSVSASSSADSQPGSWRPSSLVGLNSESVSYNPTANGHQQHKQPPSPLAGGDTKVNLNRRISSSMLELDKSPRMDEFHVIWESLSFSYTQNALSAACRGRRKPAMVLNDISGCFKSNQLVALIGPSGCGKTTLLQFLAGNNPHHKDKLRIVGLTEPKVALIAQDDCLLPGLTARETLIYASRLQNNDPDFDHEQHVVPIIHELGLTECINRNVSKLSGGQAKRVTIAQELLYPTNLLILDEVTSGLDASTSYSIVKLLKYLVSDRSYPMSIVISIHQPSAKLFSVFDQVYVMADGCCLYEGACDADLVNSYLRRFNLECPKFNNIADYLIEVATNDDLSSDKTVRDQMIQFQRKRSQLLSEDRLQDDEFTPKSRTTKMYEFNDMDASSSISSSVSYKKRKSANNNSQHHENYECEDDDESQRVSMLLNSSLYDSIATARSKKERPFWRHFGVHLGRSSLRIRRSHILTYLQLVTYVALGLQLATFYGSDIGSWSGCPKLPSSLITLVLSHETEEDLSEEMRRLQENMNFLLVAVMTATFAALEVTVITFPMEAKTLKREWHNGWYRVTSYFMGRTVADLPFQLVFVMVFCLIVYTMTGQVGLFSWRFVSFVSIMAMVALVAQAVGFTFGAIFMDNLPAAVFTAPLCIFPALLFSGFFSRVSQIPGFYKPLTYFSHFRYAFDALLVTLYGFNRCECDQDILTNYHANVHNQTGTMKEMFGYLFGSSECAPSHQPGGASNSRENSIEDTVTTSSSEPTPDIVNALLGDYVTTSTTSNPLAAALMPLGDMSGSHSINMTNSTHFRSLEDTLVDSVFEHMSNKSAEPLVGETGGSGPMDHLAHKFSSKITLMLNRQANFGHNLPEHCDNFKSYLMNEFESRDDSLMTGLVMLFIIVVVSRVICNMILTFTIANRS